MQGRVGGRDAYAFALLAIAPIAAGAPRRAMAAQECPSSGIEPAAADQNDRARLLHQAQTLAFARRYGDARAYYAWLLARDAGDMEALAAMARVDAWEGCWEKAEGEYRQALARYPEDADIRGGLIDVLMWQSRWSEAEGEIREGLERDARSPTLLARSARLAFFRGDATEAARLASLAERLAPDDEEIRELRDAIFLGQAMVDARIEAFPSGYPNVYTGGVVLLQRWHRFEVTFDSHLISRSGGGGAAITDGRRSVGVLYHPAVGVTGAIELGYGAPAVAIPATSMKLSFTSTLAWRLTGGFAYSLWEFKGERAVHLFNPTLAYQWSDSVELGLRWWTAYISIAPRPSNGNQLVADAAHSFGLHVGWHAAPPLTMTADYTYGVSLDASPTLTQLFTLRSHVVAAGADYRVRRDFGVRGALGLERRSTANDAPAILAPSIDAGFYTRW
jgi:tetratricopeptide (TPR) repeat protein